jgi:hypothetical protein
MGFSSSKKLGFYKRIFVFLIIILLTFPSLTFWIGDGGDSKLLPQEPNSFAVAASNITKPPLLKGYEMGKYQDYLTDWFNDYFYFRGFFIRLKSSLYYLANFKRFFLPSVVHLGSFKNRIVEVDDQTGYKMTIDRHKLAYGVGSKNLEQISQMTEKLKYVQQEINKRDKSFLIISGYSGWREVYGDKNSPYYRFFDNYYQDESDKIRMVFNDFLNKAGINYFNSHPFLANIAKATGIDTVSYYDSHWNRYGAGRVVVETLKYIKSIYKTDWELPQVKSVEISTTPINIETEGLSRTQMFVSVQNSFMQKKLSFPYIVYETPKKKNGAKVVLLGDSFTVPYEMQLKDSQFTDEQNIEKYHNNDSAIKTDIDKIISQNDIIIVIFVEPSFYSARLKNVVNVFYDYLKANEK